MQCIENDATVPADAGANLPDFYTYVWLDPDWERRYIAASPEGQRAMRTSGVKIQYRHAPVTTGRLMVPSPRRPLHTPGT